MGINKKNISDFIQKHYKKLLPLLFWAPVSAKAQNNVQQLNSAGDKIVNLSGAKIETSTETTSIEFRNISAEDSTITHPKYSGSDKTYVARTPKDLPEMSAGQAVLYKMRREFIGYFNSKGELEVLRTDARYCAAAPKVVTAVFRAECPHYNKNHLELRHAKDKMSRAFTDEAECLKYLKDKNNSLGEVIEDYCNFRKKYTKGKGGRKSVVVRAGFFQGGINEWTSCLRAAFCSPDENMQKFASIFIENTPENLAVRDSVINNVYKNGEFINGDEGVQKRLKTRPLLSKIRVEGIRGKIGFSQKFCDSLRYYTQKQKFDDEQKEFEHSQMVDAVKKLQEDYVIAWYLLAGNNSSSAASIDNDIAREFNKKTGKKISAKDVKKHGLGIHLSPGKILLYIESNINGGPYHKGIHPLTKTILAKFAQTFDENKMLTQEFLRQAAIVGISGAKETYEKFLQKVSALQNEEQEIVKNLERKIMRNPAPNDAIKLPLYEIHQDHKPIKMKLPQKFQQKTKQK